MGTSLEVGFVRLRGCVSEVVYRRSSRSRSSAGIVRARIAGYRGVLLVLHAAKQGERRCAYGILDVSRQRSVAMDTTLLRTTTLGTRTAASRHHLRFSAPSLIRSGADFPHPSRRDRVSAVMELDRPETSDLVRSSDSDHSQPRGSGTRADLRDPGHVGSTKPGRV